MTEKRLSADQVPVAGGGGSSALFQNAILSSKIVSGKADFLSLPGGLTARLLASGADPFQYTIGSTLVTLAANVNLTVTDNAHNFLYLDTLGNLGRSAFPPIYSYVAPGGPSTDQHWFDLGKQVMNRWDGVAWVAIDHIFVGYVRTDLGVINPAYLCEPLFLTPLERFQRYGTGVDGFLDVSVGTTTIDGSKNYTAIVVRSTGTLKHTANANTQLCCRVQGIVAILGTSGIDLNDLGGAAGSGSTPGGDGGLGAAGGGGSSPGAGGVAKAGGGHEAPSFGPGLRPGGAGSITDNVPGGTGEDSSIPADGYDAPVQNRLYGGGGGPGGGSAPSGVSSPGGGGIQLLAASVRIGATAIFRANSSNGTTPTGFSNRGGGSTGGGGIIAIFAKLFTNDNGATFTASPGSPGGEGGGSGGPGAPGGQGRAFWRRW